MLFVSVDPPSVQSGSCGSHLLNAQLPKTNKGGISVGGAQKKLLRLAIRSLDSKFILQISMIKELKS